MAVGPCCEMTSYVWMSCHLLGWPPEIACFRFRYQMRRVILKAEEAAAFQALFRILETIVPSLAASVVQSLENWPAAPQMI